MKSAAAKPTAKQAQAVPRKASRKPAPACADQPIDEQLQAALAWLKQHATRATLEGMARFALPPDKALGVSVGDLRKLAKQIGPNHDLAAALWDAGWYEARMLATFVDDPACVTAAQMDRWCKDFDNWAICDTACFALFDRTPFAWRKVEQWAGRREEFVKRAAFALVWALSVHDKGCGDEPFIQALAHIERSAGDERNFVKKAVNMALRAIGKRNVTLNAAAVAVAQRLAASQNATARWNGKDALRELTGPKVARRVARLHMNGPDRAQLQAP